MAENIILTGQNAPAFCLHNQYDEELCLKDFKEKWVILYFYPKDNTSGCTIEARDFTKLKTDFENENAVVIGISKDSILSHQKFYQKQNLDIILLADTELAVHKLYDVWKLKKFMGKEFMGTIRTTYLINPDGKVEYIWNKVKTKDHAQIVFEKLIEIKKYNVTKINE